MGKARFIRRVAAVAITLALTLLSVSAAEKFVSFDKGDKMLCKKGETFGIVVSDKDNIAVKIAAKNLANDLKAVIDANAEIISEKSAESARIVIGTVGKSSVIDALVKEGKIDGKELRGKIEKYIITLCDGNLVIAGSDRRGTVYGIYEVSRQIGVSPWYYWMDVPVKKQNTIYINRGVFTDGEPAVRYRGIFLNDEAPCLTTWVKNTFKTNFGGHEFYAKVFELILRLKGNYIWPAMWSWAFYADDPLNMKTADDMGVMIGTSHHEPMARSQKEWHGHSDDPNADAQDLKSRQNDTHQWNYETNKEGLDKFWRGGVERNKHTEDIITIGMRGDGDMAMSEDRNTKLLESVVKNQRKIISQVHGKPAKDVPQLWALYKEVQDYYDDGMRVPDDVIMLLCDDNWGNVRRVPNAKERKHPGGWGLYYHVDYVGAPRNSKVLNCTPIQNMWEQLSLAYENGIDKLWILNVGDLKPMEYPIQLFMDLAWQGTGKYTPTTLVSNHTVPFCASIIGETEAKEAAAILNRYCKLAGRVTPEMLDANTYNLSSGEWAQVVDEWKTLELQALRQYARVCPKARDAYFQLILFPVQFMCNLYDMYYAQAMNNKLYKDGDAAMDYWAERCEKAFKRDAELMRQYNQDIAGGKWNGMMIQKHIGYTSWNDSFKADIQPKVYRAENVTNVFDENSKGYVAMEAEHYNSKTDGQGAQWTVIPDMGRTLSAVTLMPQTGDVRNASLTYKFIYKGKAEKAKVHIVTKSTLDYLNKGGLTYSIKMDGGDSVIVNFNSDMNEAPENIYDKYYPTIARRVIEKVVEVPVSETSDSMHSLTFIPNDPGIVLEKIVVDFGGYKKQYLFGKESLRK